MVSLELAATRITIISKTKNVIRHHLQLTSYCQRLQFEIMPKAKSKSGKAKARDEVSEDMLDAEQPGCSFWNVGEVGQEVEKPRPNSKAPKGEKTICPICDQRFSNRFAVARHLKKQHEASPADYDLSSTYKQCSGCHKWLTNMSKHRSACKKTFEVRKEIKKTAIEKVPNNFGLGGEKFLAEWIQYIKPKVRKTTAENYTRKLQQIVHFFETSIDGFKMDMLLFPLELELTFPPLQGYLDESDNGFDRAQAIKTYKYICGLTIQNFSKRYSVRSFPIEKKMAFRSSVREERDEYCKMLKAENKKNEHTTAENKAKKAADPTEVSLVRLKEICAEILTDKRLKNDLKNIQTMTTEEIMKNYEEPQIRHMIISLLLLTSNGDRPSAVTNMKIGEFQRAVVANNGIPVVKVKDYKGFESHGPCCVTFCLPGLHEATTMYLHTFRDPNEVSTPIFATNNGLCPDAKHSINWLKEKVLPRICEKEEIQKISPKTFRKGYSNWAPRHPDPAVGAMACRVMKHSAAVQKSNYAVPDTEESSYFGLAMLQHILGDQLPAVDDHNTPSEHSENRSKVDEHPGAESTNKDERINHKGRGTLTASEKKVTVAAFFVDNEPPPTFNKKMVANEVRTNTSFKTVYERLLSVKKSPIKVQNTLYKCIMPKK